jgi:nucleoside-diphosphate-sugar epimerase
LGIRQILLGAGGAIGNPLARELLGSGETVKLVSRTARTLAGAEWAKADLTRGKDTLDAIDDGSIVYLLAGLPYNTTIWQDQWPKVMQNVIEACKARRAKLLFFDNVYLYGRVNGPMVEDTPVNPSSRKGEVRAQIAAHLLEESSRGNLLALIARSADFYGPYSAQSSVPFLLALDRLAKGKRAQWLVNAKVKHSLTYTMDCARALVRLAREDSAFGQVWHLPTARPPLTGEEFVQIAAEKLGEPPGVAVLREWMLRLTGLVNPVVRETLEMLYQNDQPYIFDSAKFERSFSFTPTPYPEGIAETIAFYHLEGKPAR